MLDQIVTSGLAMGAIYALIALGYAFVWNTMAIVNFAAGEFVTFAAYIFVATFITALGFPFIVAVKGLDRAAIIARFAERIERDRATEFEEALQQIARIAWFRLEALVEA